MTGTEFERQTAQRLRDCGWWVLVIPRGNGGKQPFDLLAIKNARILAIDCKVCKSGRFDCRRIEDNQHLAFGVIHKKTDADCIFVCTDESKSYVLPYENTIGRTSVKLTDMVDLGEWL